MGRRSFAITLPFGVLGVVALAWWTTGPGPVSSRESSLQSPTFASEAADMDMPSRVRWIAVGGGAEPASSQVSLEQDLAMAQQALGRSGEGILLHAAGSSGHGVQEIANSAAAIPGPISLTQRLGELLDPRGSRGTRYRPSRIAPLGAATLANTSAAVRHALRRGDEPLVLFAAAHGEPGEVPEDSAVLLWGGFGLSALDLGRLLDEAPASRQVRVIVAACFAGGFADIAFADADPKQGAALTDRCGLFATTWDSESSGCDPNPDRTVQQGYSLHFFHALMGQDRNGEALPAEAVDFDGDGVISLLEAHTRVRIASRSIDVPTTTSERWLRAFAPDEGPEVDVPLVEEAAVIDALGAALSLHDAEAGRAHLEELDARLTRAEHTLTALQDEADVRYADLRTALLERWPHIDDPWSHAFRRTVQRDRGRIGSFLDNSAHANAYRAAALALDHIASEADALRGDYSLTRRLVRAHDNVALARKLRGQGGPAWERYEALLACERGGV